MRVDLRQVLEMVKGSRMYAPFARIANLEKYTLLSPPYEKKAVKELVIRFQQELGFRVPNEYYWLLKCCDGGYLFTNRLYSILDADLDNDMAECNLYLREEGFIPADTVAIGETNYGAYILLKKSGTPAMALWDNVEERFLAEYDDLFAWLDDVLAEAQYLLKENALPVIYAPDDAGGE